MSKINNSFSNKCNIKCVNSINIFLINVIAKNMSKGINKKNFQFKFHIEEISSYEIQTSQRSLPHILENGKNLNYLPYFI